MRSCHVLIAIVLTAATATSQMFVRFATSPFSTPPQGPVIAAIDGDGDGKNDLLVANTTTNAIDFYRYEGPQEFVLSQSSPWTTAPSISQVHEPAFGDIDGDGDVDILRGNTIVENLGGGAFQVIGAPVGSVLLAQQPQLLDIEGDGDLDFLQGGSLLRNDGNWTFVPITGSNAPNMPWLAHCTTLLDAERDGDMDFAIGCYFPAPVVYLFRNDGNGLFAREQVFNPGMQQFRLYAADMDSDGNHDIAVAGNTQSHLLTNDGSGTFTSQTIELGSNYNGLLVDLHSSGFIQFVTTTGLIRPDPFLTLLDPYPPEIETPATPIVADLDGDLDLDIVISAQATILTNKGNGLQSASAPQIATPIGMHGQRTGKTVYGLLREATVVSWTFNEVLTYSTAHTTHGLRNVEFLGPAPTGVTDATLVGRTGEFGYAVFGQELVTCTTTGPRHFTNTWRWTELNSPLPPLGTPTHVASADIDNAFGDDLVFGDPTVAGPRIAWQTGTGFTEQSPSLPPAAPSTLPVYETVVIADMDGDDDLDIVHELRIVRNDGGGQWSAGNAITATLSPATTRFSAIDFDGDGDQDLLAHGGPIQLLENDNGTFVDVTFGRIPIQAWSADVVGVADVDRDGDDDILSSGITFLRNDSGVFSLIPNTVTGFASGIALDVNFDDSIDIVTATSVLENTLNYLRPIRRAAVGGNWELEVRTWREGALPQVAFIAITSNPGLPIYHPLGAMGALRIDLSMAEVTPIALTGGTGTHVLAIPASPLVLGAELQAQALVVDSRLLLTGVVTDDLR